MSEMMGVFGPRDGEGVYEPRPSDSVGLTPFDHEKRAIDELLLRAQRTINDAHDLAAAFWPNRVTAGNLKGLIEVIKVYRDRIHTLREV